MFIKGKKTNKLVYLFVISCVFSEERALQMKEWLKHNSEPFTQVQSYMRDTVLCRANWIWANGSKDILDILTEYPHLTSPGMVWLHSYFNIVAKPYLYPVSKEQILYFKKFSVFLFLKIAQDFQVLHGEAAPKLFETWLLEYTEKVLYLAKQDNKLPSFDVEDMTLGKFKCWYLFIYIFLYSNFIFHTILIILLTYRGQRGTSS